MRVQLQSYNKSIFCNADSGKQATSFFVDYLLDLINSFNDNKNFFNELLKEFKSDYQNLNYFRGIFTISTLQKSGHQKIDCFERLTV